MVEDQQRPAPISAILVSYFTGPVLTRALKALGEQTEIGEIIIVDNGNPDGALDAAIRTAKLDQRPHIISGHGNVGFARGCNMGAIKAVGAYLLFINPDAVLDKGGAAQLLDDSARLAQPWLLGVTLVGDDGAEQQGSRRAELTPLSALNDAFGLPRVFQSGPFSRRFNLHHTPAPQSVAPIPTISGACMFILRADYFLIKGMDEQYFLHVEDVDFCRRFTSAGGGVYVTPHVRLLHFKSSSRVASLVVERHKLRSMQQYFQTHFGGKTPQPLLLGFRALLWLRFILMVLAWRARFGLRVLKLTLRFGPKALRRALKI